MFFIKNALHFVKYPSFFKHTFLILSLIASAVKGISQDSSLPKTVTYSHQNIDSKSLFSFNKNTEQYNYPFNKKRVKAVAISNVALFSAGMVGLYAAWYKDYPQSKFHFFNDNSEWMQIDKIGHAYSAYAESKASMELWRWTGISRKKRILFGGFSGAAYQTVIETLDGLSTEWGWSWGDFAANITGSSLLVAQEFAWDEQRIQFKFSFHKKNMPIIP